MHPTGTTHHATQLHHRLTAQQWLAVVGGSAVLAVSAGLMLVSRVEKKQVEVEVVGQWYDAAERFTRETIRLSFTNRKLGTSSEAVFVAPKGLLDKDGIFSWLDDSMDYSSKLENTAVAAIAPEGLLDPEWLPALKSAPTRKESR